MSLKSLKDTIVAIATPPGRGGVGIIRISGPEATLKSISLELLENTCQKEESDDKALKNFKQFSFKPRQTYFRRVVDSHNRIIDEGLVIYFAAPSSFTGEHVLEFQGHGGPVVMDAVLQRAVQLGARLARPGEFSERAFLNDKIDLVQAEAIADLIDSSSQQAARCAVRSLQGVFSKKIHTLNELLILLRTYTEASIDFPEEEVDFLSNKEVAVQLSELIDQLALIRNEACQGSVINEGINVVIAGPPNAGKSSLLNYLSGLDSAIVTDIPGTTRDLLREKIVIDGLPVNIIDTAGLRESDEVVEQEGIRRAKVALGQADQIIFVSDGTEDPNAKDGQTLKLLEQLQVDHIPLIWVKNKLDLMVQQEPSLSVQKGHSKICLSVKTGQGVALLTEQIKKIAGFNEVGEGSYTARRRHLDALDRVSENLQEAQIQLQSGAGELMAEELRLAQQALGEITGEFSSDDLLGSIFSSFCIGK